MYKKLIPLILLLSLLLSISVFAADSGAGTMLYTTGEVIAPGLEAFSAVYAGENGTMQAGYSLELSPDSSVFPIMMACDTMYGGMDLETAVAYTRSQGYNVVAAVNTAFFTGASVPIGHVVEEGRLRSAGDGMNAMAIMNDGSYYASAGPRVRFQLSSTAWGAETMELQYLNKALESDDIYIYTNDFSTVSTRVTDLVWAVRMRITDGAFALGGTVTMEVVETLPYGPNVPLGEGEVVLTARQNGVNGELFRKFYLGTTVTMDIQCSDEKLLDALYVTGCGEILAENGKLTEESSWFSFNEGRHPRTLVGWRSDGTLVLYVADGRRSGYAEGLTLRMAGEEMLRRACQTVVNMDGGGSAVLGVRLPGEWVVEPMNRPSEGMTRPCAAYLMLVTDAVSDGVPRYWHLAENGSFLLPNQKLALHTFATDKGLYPTLAEGEGLLYSTRAGITNEPVFIAPEQGGRHTVQIFGGGASGSGELRVIPHPTDLTVTFADGKPLRDLTVVNGQKLDLNITASHYGVPIFADETCVTYESDLSLGKPDENGVFTVHTLAGLRGNLTMRVADREYTIRLTVVNSPTDIRDHRMKGALDLYMK